MVIDHGSLNSDVLVNPGLGMAPVFRITSTIIALADATEHDRNRLRRLALRVQYLALVYNTIAHANAPAGWVPPISAYESRPAKTPVSHLLSRDKEDKSGVLSRRSSTLSLALSLVSGGGGANNNSTSTTNTAVDMISNNANNNEADSPPPSPADSSAARPISRAWRAVSRLSLRALNTNVSAPSLSSPSASSALSPSSRPSSSNANINPGCITLKNSKPPPDRLSCEMLVVLLERIKGFFKNTNTNDLLRICGSRRRFELRLRSFQALVKTWTEETGDGITNPETYDIDDVTDLVADTEALKKILASLIKKATGDRTYLNHSPSSSGTPKSHSSDDGTYFDEEDNSHAGDDDDDSTDDDSADFSILTHVHIPLGQEGAAREFAERRFKELDALVRESTALQAVFGNNSSSAIPLTAIPEQDESQDETTDEITSAYISSSSDSQHYSIDMPLEVKWLGLLVKALSAYEPLDLKPNNGSVVISPYDLDEDGDGAPLGPVGISESVLGSLVIRTSEDGGEFDDKRVVIKRFRSGRRMQWNMKDLLDEKSKTWLSTSNDPRVLSIIGICFSAVPQIIVTPYMKNGNILSYSKLHPGYSLRLLYETASTMSVLHGMGILHGGLRASNVLVDDDGKAIVADFGLWDYRLEAAADGVARNGWRRWNAPEVLRGGKFRPHSDVYSFAMTMYEILTGQIPFHNTLKDPDDPDSGFDPDNEESDIARLVLFDSIRPHKPSHCPDKFWTLIESCWAQDPVHRPTFSSVEFQLQSLLKLQSAFRRQSQIKSRAEAFIVEVPLDDLMASVMSAGGVTPSSPSLVAENDSERNLARTSTNSTISVNLTFNLDSNIRLSTIPTLALGIDLPPAKEEDQEGKNDDDLLDEYLSEDPAYNSEFDESVIAFWDVLINSTEPIISAATISWPDFVKCLRTQYPTLVGSIPSLKASFDPTNSGAATFADFKKYLISQVPESAVSDNDSLFQFEAVFGQFCAAVDAERNPQSTGPIDLHKIEDMVVSVTGGFAMMSASSASSSSTSVSSANGVRSGENSTAFICSIVAVPNGAGIDILKMLVDPRVQILGSEDDYNGSENQQRKRQRTFAEISNAPTTVDSKGMMPLHIAAKLGGGAGPAEMVRLLLENGCDLAIRTKKGRWTALHIAAWNGSLTMVKVMLEWMQENNETGLVKAVDEEGWTCLMHAARYAHLEICRAITEFVRKEFGDQDEDVFVDMCLPALQISRKYGWEEGVAYFESQL
ncbi:hypothetical protein HK100_010559 [Physocladia obscura]|uniref:Protein kinase domain-containing protein n=1 Tax=Physocladia obscura TaxID=109957 RepID=A0AAD5XEM9_9FUNG|nr:hypothetical protein HK100_010559 [Physocladia obscura]